MFLCYPFALEKMNEKRLQNWNCLLSLLAWSLQLSMARLFYSSCAWLDLCAIVAIVLKCRCCWCFGVLVLLFFNTLVLFECIGIIHACWCYFNTLVLMLFLNIGVANVFEHYYCRYFQMMHRFVVLGCCKTSPKR